MSQNRFEKLDDGNRFESVNKTDRFEKSPQSPEGVRNPPAKAEGMDIKDLLYRIPAQANIGISQMLGLPKIGADIIRNMAGYEEESGFPSAEEIQSKMSDLGMTYEPGEQPDTTMDRFLQYMGASSIPLAGIVGKTGKVALPLFEEMLASTGAAAGGKAAQSTSWGKEHPTLARAVGELAGGLGSNPATANKLARFTGRVVRHPFRHTPFALAKMPFRGQWAENRAVKRLSDLGIEPGTKATGKGGLTPSQEIDNPNLAELRRRIEDEYPTEAKMGETQRSEKMAEITGEAKTGTTDIEDTRNYIEQTFNDAASDAEHYLKRATNTDDPLIYNKAANKKIIDAYRIAREQEDKVWNNLSSDTTVAPRRMMDAYTEEYQNITEGGDIEELPKFVRKKLGRPNSKTGKLTNGELVTEKKPNTSAKAVHQFYSRLGREVRKQAEGAGNSNKIRILNKLRRAALQDLEDSAVGGEYKEAIKLSRDLNDKFTQGAVGDILGFNRGLATPETQTLDDILTGTQQQVKDKVDQLLKAGPNIKDDIRGMVKSRFALSAQNQENMRINKTLGDKFIQKNKKLLKAFPDLKQELQKAVDSQARVDQLSGIGKVADYSPLVKEKSAASIFLGSDPGDEIQRFIKTGKAKGRTKDFLQDLNKEVSRDSTGKAKAGLKNAFVEEMINFSRKSEIEDPITKEGIISGRKFLERLSNLERPLIESGFMSEGEVNRLRQIGKSLQGLETEIRAKGQEPILTGGVGRALDWVSSAVGANVGGKLSGHGIGPGMVMAQRTADLSRNVVRSLTKDEAVSLLVDATKTPETFNRLSQKIGKLKESEIKQLGNWVLEKAKNLSGKRPPAGSTIPAISHAAKSGRESKEKQDLKEQLNNL